ncbi:DNA-binding anti-repressor SinI [Bacillus mangrovi]|uniref:DNA-binding anti-repressor SinI n=1 Tax=Metabacillus mangrovi TaxID=1491830 RepID=A0A7X2V3G9_9BACI|nr:anti-repressor SinI family protein [Metabacillus mangrovi]MTH52395.1 DNA-binding anti-repressor SinI [Metabacillus mangrovi]
MSNQSNGSAEEWIHLLLEAKALGLTPDEVREFLTENNRSVVL